MVLRARRMGCSQQNSGGADQPATNASPASPQPRHAPGFRSPGERGRHLHGDAGPASTTAAPTTRPGGRKPGHQRQHPPGTGNTSQHPEAPHNSAAHPRHHFTHPGPGRAGKRGRAARPVPPPQPPHSPAHQAASQNLHPPPSAPAPGSQCPGALCTPRAPRGSAHLPTACPTATWPPQTCVQRRAQKSTPKNAAERDAVGSAGQAVGAWMATPLAAEKTGPEQRFGGCRHPRPWRGKTERHQSGSEVLVPSSTMVDEEVPLQPVWKR